MSKCFSFFKNVSLNTPEYTAAASQAARRHVPEAGSDFSTIINQQIETARHPTTKNEHADARPSGEMKPQKLEKLGTVTQSVSTVSELLIRHPEYKKDCWQIIYAKENIDKPYTQIPAGTDIYLNPDTRELVWQTEAAENIARQPSESVCPSSTPDESSSPVLASSGVPGPEKNVAFKKTETHFTQELVNVARSFIGTPYHKMNCYEMVVEGLETMGVRYHGKGGLAEHLKDMAARQGRSRYACFNGEGLIQASGTNVFSKTITSVKDFDAESDTILEEMTPRLEKGMLLSFSTTSRGHTGIISQKGPGWTFINSGWLDHDIENRPHQKGVGEERLGDEIKNWLKVAARQNEPLQITVGRFGKEGLDPFRMQQASISSTPSLSRKI